MRLKISHGLQGSLQLQTFSRIWTTYRVAHVGTGNLAASEPCYQLPLEPWQSLGLAVLPCLVCKMGTIVFTSPFNKATVKFTYLMSMKRLKTETRRARRIVSFIQQCFIWIASWLIPRVAVRGWPIWQKLMLFIFVLHWRLMSLWLGFQAKQLA